MRGKKLPDGGGHGIEDRRFVAVKADAALSTGKHPAGLVHQPQLDRRAADIDA